MAEEKRKKKYQTVVFGIGLIIIGISIFQIFIADGLQTSLTGYEEESINSSNLRDNLRGYWHNMRDVATEVGFTDYEVDYKLSLGMITELEANVTIAGALVNYHTAISTLLDEVTDIKLLSSDIYLVPEKKKEWLFSEEIISLHWMTYDLNTSKFNSYSNFSTNFDIFNNPTVNWTFNYNYTLNIAEDYWYHPITISLLGFLPFDIIIDWVTFDNYVFTHIISPQLNSERIFEQIRIAMNMNTIAVLALGFLVDFSLLSNKWVLGYIVIILVMVFISFYFSFIAWI